MIRSLKGSEAWTDQKPGMIRELVTSDTPAAKDGDGRIEEDLEVYKKRHILNVKDIVPQPFDHFLHILRITVFDLSP